MTPREAHTPGARWHGTVNGYNYHRCGCDACRAAWSERMSKTRARRQRRLNLFAENQRELEKRALAWLMNQRPDVYDRILAEVLEKSRRRYSRR